MEMYAHQVIHLLSLTIPADFILAACDVEGNFLVIKAYNYTDLLSCMLLDAWAIPVCLFFCWVYMRTKYHWTQLLGVVVCIGGLGMLVASDMLTDKDFPALNKGKGDAFMIVGATLYGFSEFCSPCRAISYWTPSLRSQRNRGVSR
jgi:hypothetical protein